MVSLLDLVGNEGGPEFFYQRRPVDVPGDGEAFRRIAFEHLAADMHGAVGRAGDEGAADLQVGLDRKAGKILPAEFRRRQRPPHLLGRGGDVDGVDDGRLEFSEIHRKAQLSNFIAA
jgi:hypothetical protein